MNQFVDINTVVETAASVLPGVSDEEKAYMREWAYMAMKEIGPTGLDRKTEEQIPVNDLIVMKPTDCVYVEDIALYTKDLGEVRHVFEGRGLKIHKHDGAYWSYAHISEMPGYFQLSSNAASVKWAKLTYLGLPLDEDGMPKVPDRAVDAVVMYLRSNFYGGRGKEAEYANMRKMFERQKVRAKASMKTPAKYNAREFGRTWLSMIDRAIDKTKYQN